MCLQKQIIKAALSSVATRVDVLMKCDTLTKSGDSMTEDVEMCVYTFSRTFYLLTWP